MATATPLMIIPKPTRQQETYATWETFIARVAERFSELEQSGDAASWEKATLVIDADHEARTYPECRGLPPQHISRKVNTACLAWWIAHKKPYPKVSFLSHARRVHATWQDLFAVDRKAHVLPYDAYMRMVMCALPVDQKQALRTWAETERPTQKALRQTIRDRVDALQGIYRPDFDLKVSNHWVFQSDTKRLDGFEGGVNPELYANLIHSFSDPGDTILDPFAGGGLLTAVLDGYRHFREVTQAAHSGPRQALMSDIAPVRPDILQADAREGLPFPDACASLAILDPPYLRMAEGKYQDFGEVLDDWRRNLHAVLPHVARCLVPGGLMVIMSDDVVRKQYHVPVGFAIVGMFQGLGWELVTTIYNFNRNFIAMAPVEMARMKDRRLHVNAVKLIQVARKPF